MKSVNGLKMKLNEAIRWCWKFREPFKIVTEVTSMKKCSTPKIKIRKQVYLGEFKIEEYLLKEVELLIEKMKNM
jgi:hypothetical protein